VEFFEKPSAISRPLRHSFLGVTAFLLPAALVIVSLTLACIALFSHPPSAAAAVMVDHLMWVLPLSFIGLFVGIAALKQRQTHKRFVKWGMVACALPTLLLAVSLLIRCCMV